MSEQQIFGSTKYHFFISYASEERSEGAEPLANLLTSKGFLVWYDDFEFRPGDSISEEIDFGISNSHFFIPILSSRYFSKTWARRELAGAVSKETLFGKQAIVPILHGIDFRYARQR